MLNVTQLTDVMAIQHEGTLAERYDPNPQTIQFEDPLNYTATYAAAGINFITIANNHQVDYGWAGLQSTRKTLAQTGIPFGGVGNTAEAVRRPTVLPVEAADGSLVRVAFCACSAVERTRAHTLCALAPLLLRSTI